MLAWPVACLLLEPHKSAVLIGAGDVSNDPSIGRRLAFVNVSLRGGVGPLFVSDANASAGGQ